MSHGVTCAISLLPIQPGSAVRVLLLTENPYAEGKGSAACYINDHWVPRTLPITGELGEYGELDECEIGLGPELWVEGLRMDMVEAGVGDNQIHDAGASAEDDFDGLWQSLRVGGVRVVRKAMTRQDAEADSDYETSEYRLRDREKRAAVELANGIPSLRNVRELLMGAAGDLLIDEKARGDVRIRVSGYDNRLAPLQAVLSSGVLDRFATALTAGSGTSGFSPEIRVFPKPDAKEWHGSPPPLFAGKDLQVAPAYIREDIWQAILTTPISWPYDPAKHTFEQVYTDVVAYYGYVRTAIEQSEEALAKAIEKHGADSDNVKWAKRHTIGSSMFQFRVEEVAEVASGLPEDEKWKASRGTANWYLSTGTGKAGGCPPYMIGPAHHFDMFCRRGLTADAAEPWLRKFSELIYVYQFMTAANRLWAPSWHARDNNPLYPKFLRMCAKVYDTNIRDEKRASRERFTRLMTRK